MTVGIIGGTGIYEIVELGTELENKVLQTPYGNSPEMTLFNLHGRTVVFMSRHAAGHAHPPHMVNYQANIWALKKMGVDRIIATNAVGSMHQSIKPGDLVVPHDFLDFTRLRKNTFYDDRTVHVDVTRPYCTQLRDILNSSRKVIEKGVYVCTEGPRFETGAEVQMYRQLGGTVVGMTGLPEAVLSRELEMCYASVCTVSNYAASISPDKLTIDEVFDEVEKKRGVLIELISDTIKKIPESYNCNCRSALDGAEVKSSQKSEDL
ncbi:MAG TPA: S-methyl-5'-thioadenosine phosphorylase [Methanobacterium sp.]|nr:S-methyl-5'-thioadenosine phosphorylase [Methanobacterium sp.]